MSAKAPSSSSPARQRRKEARPQELLGAALDLFVEKGFAATKTEEVASRAGVAKGTLYLYDPSKEDLLKAVVRENLSALIAEGATIASTFEGPTDELDRIETELRDGPPGAVVDAVQAVRMPATGRFDGFEVRSAGHTGD